MKIEACWKHIGVWRNDKDNTVACPKLVELIHCRHCEHFSQSGIILLDRPIPDGQRQAWARDLSSNKQHNEYYQDKNTTRQSFVFRVQYAWFALDAAILNKVVKPTDVCPLPHTSHHVLHGVVAIGGVLKLCISLEAYFDLEYCPQPAASHMLLLGEAGRDYVFAVQEVHGLLTWHENNVHASLENNHACQLSLLHTQLGEVVLLDANALLAALDALLSEHK